jgi:mycofactocin system glycosyltransferase
MTRRIPSAAGRNPSPQEVGVQSDSGLPLGFRVEFDAETRELRRGLLFGGSPGRILRVNEPGARAIDELRRGAVATAAAATLGRRLTDANLAYPVPPRPRAAMGEVTVVIPVRDRARQLERCLAGLGPSHPVVVVDDGSRWPAQTKAICQRHGARLLAHSVSRGPGPARNTALRQVSTPFVAFIDSDCVAPADWIAGLLAHTADPLVAAVGARLIPLRAPGGASSTTFARYAEARSPLDLGDRPSTVRPGTRVAYLPSANLLVRRAAIGDGFDESLRYGEDVDLVWRLVEAGWRVRYDPAVVVEHEEPDSGGRVLRRRFDYGTSAAPLAARHPGSVPSLVLQPGPALTVALILARRPRLALVTHGLATMLLIRRLRRADIPTEGVLRATTLGVWHTWLGLGRWVTQFASLPAVALAVRPGGRDRARRWGRRLGVVSLLVGPPLVEWQRRHPDLGPVRFAVAAIGDEVAYGLGVWWGCRRLHHYAAVWPRPAVPSVSDSPPPAAAEKGAGAEPTTIKDRHG